MGVESVCRVRTLDVPVLLAAAVLSVIGGSLAFLDSSLKKRVASVVSAIAALASVGAYIRLVHAYNSTERFRVMVAAGNPVAGLGPWDLLALLLGGCAIVASVLGSRKACLLLLTSGVLAVGYTLLTLAFWD